MRHQRALLGVAMTKESVSKEVNLQALYDFAMSDEAENPEERLQRLYGDMLTESEQRVEAERLKQGMPKNG